MLVVCVALGWYVERVRRQQRAVAALEADGAKVYYADSADGWSFFGAKDFSAGKTVEKPQTFAQWVEFLTPRQIRTALGVDFFRNVHAVYYPREHDFPHDPSYLADLPGLRKLELNSVLDDDLAAIGSLDGLTQLQLSDSIVSDAGLAHLSGLKNLESLDISFEQDVFTSVSHQPVTDAGLAHLADLRRLKKLDLSGSSVRGDGLRHLVEMTELQNLDLGETKLTDAALVHLAQLPRLKWLDIHDTVVSQDLAEKMLPRTEVTRDDDGFDPPLTRGQTLLHAGLWEQALETLRHENDTWLQARLSQTNQYDIGRCHVELGHVREATDVFCALLEDVHRIPPPMGRFSESAVWQRLYDWPLVFESVVRARPNDYWSSVTMAQRSIIEARWTDAAAHYSRAMEFPLNERFGTDCGPIEVQYAISRVVIGDLSARDNVCTDLVNREKRFAERLRVEHELKRRFVQDLPRFFSGYSTYLRFLAPQGSVSISEISEWLRGEAASSWQSDLLPLAYLRAGEFEKVIKQDLPDPRKAGRSWFCQAMAYHRLGRSAQARESYARGVQWLNRHMKDDGLRGVQSYVADYLECEVLRREAAKLIEH